MKKKRRWRIKQCCDSLRNFDVVEKQIKDNQRPDHPIFEIETWSDDTWYIKFCPFCGEKLRYCKEPR